MTGSALRALRRRAAPGAQNHEALGNTVGLGKQSGASLYFLPMAPHIEELPRAARPPRPVLGSAANPGKGTYDNPSR